jgi:aryl-alcohol dehydrogenase-like predicted oxidoreductase
MIQRSLGDGLSVSVLGIGCSRVGSISNPTPMREIQATLETAIEAGINLFDTADIYGQGDSERALARLLHRYGDRMFVVTKVGGRHSRYASVVRLAKPLLRTIARSRPDMRSAVIAARTATVVHDFSPHDLLAAVDASRRRLRLDQLHGLLLHSPSPELLRKPEIHDFLAALLRNRKARRVGVSVDSLAALEAAVSIPAVSLIQAPLEVIESLPGTASLDFLRQRGIGLFAREILRRFGPGGHEKPARREALAAAIAPDFVTAAIVGVSTRQHLDELLSWIA